MSAGLPARSGWWAVVARCGDLIGISACADIVLADVDDGGGEGGASMRNPENGASYAQRWPPNEPMATSTWEPQGTRPPPLSARYAFQELRSSFEQ